MASSFVGTNSRTLTSGTRPSRRASPFPPAPKSVRVLSVFNEGVPEVPLPEHAPPTSQYRQRASWALWFLGITVISGLILAAVFWGVF